MPVRLWSFPCKNSAKANAEFDTILQLSCGRLRRGSSLHPKIAGSFCPIADANNGAKGLTLYTASLLSGSSLPGLWRQDSSPLHRVQSRICFTQQTLNRIIVLRMDRDTEANGKLWRLSVIGNAFADTSCY